LDPDVKDSLFVFLTGLKTLVAAFEEEQLVAAFVTAAIRP
jgi:hypothetical protein